MTLFVHMYAYVCSPFDHGMINASTTQNSSSDPTTLRALISIVFSYNRPNRRTIGRLVENFESTHSLHNLSVPARQRSAWIEENTAAAREVICDLGHWTFVSPVWTEFFDKIIKLQGRFRSRS